MRKIAFVDIRLQCWIVITQLIGGKNDRESKQKTTTAQEPENGETLMPNQCRAIICTTLTKPPFFQESQFGDYKRPINWRAQLQAGSPHGRLLAAIGAQEQGPAKWILNDYFTATKNDPGIRSMGGFMGRMENRFKKSSDDLVLSKLSIWGDFRKKKR